MTVTRVPSMLRAFYRKYIVSAAWKERARQAKERAGWRCQVPGCGAEGTPDEPLGVHHLTYERLGHELPEDLIVLCEECHAREHEGEDGEDGRERHYRE